MRAAFVPLAVVLFAAPAAGAALPPAHDDAPLRAVQFVDASEGWAVGDDGLILHTTDGGKTWDRQKSGTRASLRAVQFLTPYTGWAAGRVEKPAGGGVLLATTDGGLTWAEVAAGQLPGLNAVHFFDGKTGIVAGDGSNAFPGGAFLTRDGGAGWVPVEGPPCPAWLAADFADAGNGLFGGAWGSAAAFRDGKLTPAPADIPGGRAVHAVKRSGNRGVMAGDGGMVLLAADVGPWAAAELPLPPEARSACDFRCLAVRGDKVWAAGRPGSVVLFSPDFGKTWEVRRTGVPVPLNGLCMISDADGWAVGEFGTVLRTADGGKTWAILRGGNRAAVLFAHATAASVPLAALPALGAKDGYLAAVLTLTSADPATAAPARAADGCRLAAAVRSAGGAAADAGWGFPLPAHCDGLSAEQLLAVWDAQAGGKAREHLLRRMVLAVRTWRPEVVVTDELGPAAAGAEQAMLYAAREAFKLAADPAAFPEQIEHLGLAPHAPKKLYARVGDDSGQVKLDVAAFRPDLADSPAGAAEPGRALLAREAAESSRHTPCAVAGGGSADAASGAGPAIESQRDRSPSPAGGRHTECACYSGRLGFRLISHRLPGAETHTNLMDGCDLARGGTARRAAELPPFAPAYVTMREGAARTRRQLADLLAPEAVEKEGEAAFTRAAELLKGMPDDAAAAALVAAADGSARAGRWTAARELYVLAANQYPTQLATTAAYRWLVRYHASGEALRRVELAQQPTFRPATFARLPHRPADGVVQASFAEPAGPRVRFRSAEAERGWVGTGVDLEPRLFAADPAVLRDPATQLSVHAGRQKLGLTADAERALAAYRRATFGPGPGANPWADAVAAELWVANRGLSAAPPKPLGACRAAAARPHLDGKLDDPCWQAATPLPLAAGPAELAASHPTEARFASDGEFLYVAVTCRHPACDPAPKAAKRRRDEDLRGRDRVDVLLDLDRDYQTYYRLRIDHRGCVAEDCTGDRTWDPRWFVAVEPTATGWTAEAAIPLAELTGTSPRPGQVWAANVVRVLPGRGVLAWSGPADADPRPEGLGLIEFRK